MSIPVIPNRYDEFSLKNGRFYEKGKVCRHTSMGFTLVVKPASHQRSNYNG
jgi:hypothetical protein